MTEIKITVEELKELLKGLHSQDTISIECVCAYDMGYGYTDDIEEIELSASNGKSIIKKN